ncbi:MAG: hypothetical protein U1B30_16470 [Pseudomonadota bacterium]|nr:hypothetical protein [Pseudomonadota bacterium]
MRWIIAILLALFLSAEVSAYDLTWTYTPGTVTHDGFRVYRKAPGESGFTVLQQLADPAARSFNDSQRITGTCYRLTAYNAIGDSPPIEACANVPDGSITIVVVK